MGFIDVAFMGFVVSSCLRGFGRAVVLGVVVTGVVGVYCVCL